MEKKALKVLVYGGTGSQMGSTVWKLLERGHIPYVLTRSAEKAAPMQQAGAKVVVGDVTDLDSLVRVSQGMDAVALMIPAFGLNPMNTAKHLDYALSAAKQAGVGIVVWNTSGPVLAERIGHPMYDQRLDLIDQVKASGIPSIIVQPTVYAENFLGPWTRPFVVEKDLLAYPVPEAMALGWCPTENVGTVIAASLERPDLAGSRFIVSGLENLTGPELADRFTAALGRKIRYYPMPLEEFGALMEQTFGPGVGEVAIAGYRFQIENAEMIPTWEDMRPVCETLRVDLVNMQTWATIRKAAFQAAI